MGSEKKHALKSIVEGLSLEFEAKNGIICTIMHEIEQLTEVRAALKVMNFKIPDADKLCAAVIETVDHDINENDVMTRMENLTDQVEEFPEEAQARLLTSKWMLSGVAREAIVVSQIALARRDPTFFVAWFDSYLAVSQLSGHLTLPNMVLGDQTALDALEYAVEVVNGGNATVASKADTYLLLNSLRGASVSLLEEDGKGFILANEAAKMMNGEKNRFSSRPYISLCDPKIEGGMASYAARLFEQQYPVAEAVLRKNKGSGPTL